MRLYTRRVGDQIHGQHGSSGLRDREAGIIERLHAARLNRVARSISDFNLEQTKAVAREVFNRFDDPDAVFCANDHMAFAVMDVVHFELGLSVPQDVSVIGYDDVWMAAWPSYDLTAEHQIVGQMARVVIDTLMDRLADPDMKLRRVAQDGPLILHGSGCRPLPSHQQPVQR